MKISSTLKKEWEQRLIDSGFVDIEREVRGVRVLKEFCASVFASLSEIARMQKEEYFHQMSLHIDDPCLKGKDRDLLKMFVSGSTISAIANTLKMDRETVRFHLRSMETAFGVRSWRSEQYSSRKTKNTSRIVVIRRKENE